MMKYFLSPDLNHAFYFPSLLGLAYCSMLNILLLEIFSIFPSVGGVVCVGFGFFGPFLCVFLVS